MKSLFFTPVIGSFSLIFVSFSFGMESATLANSGGDISGGGGSSGTNGMSQETKAPARPSTDTPRMSLKERCQIERDKGKQSKYRINNILENGKNLPYKMDLDLMKQRAECGRLINSRDGTFDFTGVVSSTVNSSSGPFQKNEDIATKISTYRRNKAFINKDPDNQAIKDSQEIAALNIFFFFKHQYPEYTITLRDIKDFPEIPLKKETVRND